MIRKVSTLLYIVVLMIIIMSTASCNDPRTYDHYESVSLRGWLRNDTLTFDIPHQWEGNYQLALGNERSSTTDTGRSMKRPIMIRLTVRSLPIRGCWQDKMASVILKYARESVRFI